MPARPGAPGPGRCRTDVPRALVALVVAVLMGLAPACSSRSRSTDPEPVVPAGRTLDQAEVAAAVDDYVARGSVTLRNIRAVLVSVDGVTRVAHYREGQPTDRTQVFSVTKSVLSTLVGIAIDQGLIPGTDADLRTLLPDHRRAMSDEVAGITVGQLVTMTSGLPGGTFGFDARLEREDWVDEVLRDGTTEPPGSIFIYSDPGANVLAAVLTAALDRRDGRRPHALLDYARTVLFDPLGIETRLAYTGSEGNDPWSARVWDAGPGWFTDHRGRNYGAVGLKLAASDLVKLGELYRDGGRFEGRQVVPESWVRAATTPILQEPQYGRMWWVGSVGVHPAFYADGRGGQLVVVVPDLMLVVVVVSRFDVEGQTNFYARGQDLLPLVDEVIVSRMT